MPGFIMNGIRLEDIFLGEGMHETRESGVCAAEAIAMMAGEMHSDHPQCLSPTIGHVLRVWNDRVGCAERQDTILPLLPELMNTNIPELEEERSYLLLDAVMRIFSPLILDRFVYNNLATELRSLPSFECRADVHKFLEGLGNENLAKSNGAWPRIFSAHVALIEAKCKNLNGVGQNSSQLIGTALNVCERENINVEIVKLLRRIVDLQN